MGDILRKEDGLYDFWPKTTSGGYWDVAILEAITTKLEELNKPWEEELDKWYAQDLDVDDFNFS